MYDLLRSLMFRLPAETSHDLALDMIGAAGRLRLADKLVRPVPSQPVQVMGLTFDNPVGLAAGLDKNAVAVDGLAAMGFGSIEVGTVTPRPQPGNPKPRLFRLTEQLAIINRFGFNNQGVDAMLERLDGVRYQGVLGINIGKNAVTPVENAVDDYLYCLRKVYDRASYVTVNLSSPNTPGLRTLQYGEALKVLLGQIKQCQQQLAAERGRYVPIAIKIAPDMTAEEVTLVGATLLEEGMDAVIATNTTLDRSAVADSPYANEAGGLSGAPLTDMSTEVIRLLADELKGRMPIIGVGGIFSGADAADKIAAGASLVQLYSGFIYRGPELVRECADAIAVMPQP
ncbi:MAG TPA: quinone-dependent dihydroorotate dehydrogenase [Pseudomonas sp.]|uniref:Dihydroorotate dehydrogenase (quinone) n=1 Tax=Halopseudomonas pachastrellae TaxID=254161 RepID=A0A1S8DJC4_9GAMM|nr:quinone-dependent dihydroorotate dehydrogenase [Halopseudomonas pachastrellae]MAQ52059.1 quinone-dependent dihydroorotate dehydrogenase [Pseudomonas sp.]MBF77410.1 quinone-dependent dihydroorotate dehydrogenase [Pseudomonadales bacterium]ONM45508.1 dihydroorotate dehydrogenase (quinone) [Halopseudomonas pachastrellae]SFM34960.1 dihydroorotate oxidase A [Halopseudomonas pachastrellae]HCA23312.1 quinone-dependent dihydroorotate dehydrogenase [Pseudomonas sp.]|tara:strand:+ start:1947 stop:2972 length:1026 start_codon:yes stop_codon:yes gene_type:complete